jgi:hypothetical protein
MRIDDLQASIHPRLKSAEVPVRERFDARKGL